MPPTHAQGPEFASSELIQKLYAAAMSVAPGFRDGQIPEAPQTVCIAISLISVFSDRCGVKTKIKISVSTYAHVCICKCIYFVDMHLPT